MVDPSPWPLTRAMVMFRITSCSVIYFNGYSMPSFVMDIGFITMLGAIAVWWRDVTREATFEGNHTTMVQLGRRMGIRRFIVSEVMFFFAFFWAFFASARNPTPAIGSVWPPVGIEVRSAWEVPLLNTIVLLSSGVSVTWAHHAIVSGDRDGAIEGLLVTVGRAIFFTMLQALEYVSAQFTISDSVFGSTFYMATGFHGFHVFIGTCFLSVGLVRVVYNHFTVTHHFGFEAAAWYWHFVDVVWRFLFATIYWWGGV
jgi:heme/copper-type cytochrome/quinol oxidase subunit 3